MWHSGRSSYLGLFTNEIDAANACANFVANVDGKGGSGGVAVGNREVKKKRATKTSRFTGVCWHKALRKWQVRAKVGAQHKYLGVFDDEETAARAYDNVAGALGRKLNFPVGGGAGSSSVGSGSSASVAAQPVAIDVDLRIQISSSSRAMKRGSSEMEEEEDQAVDELSPYEQARAKKLRRNACKLASLGIASASEAMRTGAGSSSGTSAASVGAANISGVSSAVAASVAAPAVASARQIELEARRAELALIAPAATPAELARIALAAVAALQQEQQEQQVVQQVVQVQPPVPLKMEPQPLSLLAFGSQKTEQQPLSLLDGFAMAPEDVMGSAM